MSDQAKALPKISTKARLFVALWRLRIELDALDWPKPGNDRARGRGRAGGMGGDRGERARGYGGASARRSLTTWCVLETGERGTAATPDRPALLTLETQ